MPGALRDWKAFGDPDLETCLAMVWGKGAFIGTTFGWGTPRNYTLPAGTLKEGENVILVNVRNGWAEGGMTGSEDALFLRLASRERVSLAGG